MQKKANAVIVCMTTAFVKIKYVNFLDVFFFEQGENVILGK